MRFEGADLLPQVEAADPLPWRANFLIGPKDRWRVGVVLFGEVAYRSLYPGIDMIYGRSGRDLKSEFVLAPGADPSRIRMRYSGAGVLRIDESGSLVIPLGAGELRERSPEVYQEKEGRRIPVQGRFFLQGRAAAGFVIGDYDVSLPLVIDPVLSYSTLLGGSGADAATALAVDSTGSAYITGFTASSDFPTSNAVRNTNAGGNDVFVAKLSPSGNELVYCTYLGGSADDRGYGIAVDSTGSAYIAGSTTSTNFPVRNALQSKLAGGRNAFIVKLNPAGNSLVYATYLGGSGSDAASGIALDSSGNAYVVGDTTSLNFPAAGLQSSKPWRTGRFCRQAQPGWKPPHLQHISGRRQRRSRCRHCGGCGRGRIRSGGNAVG